MKGKFFKVAKEVVQIVGVSAISAAWVLNGLAHIDERQAKRRSSTSNRKTSVTPSAVGGRASEKENVVDAKPDVVLKPR